MEHLQQKDLQVLLQAYGQKKKGLGIWILKYTESAYQIGLENTRCH